LDEIGDRTPRIVTGGVGVSGNAFVDNIDKRAQLFGEFAALTTDMESAAVGQVCTVNDIPFIVFRSASDLAGGSGSETAGDELNQFFQVAADNSSKVVTAFIGQLE
jgi:adenosylhomocysteine nucleosidase